MTKFIPILLCLLLTATTARAQSSRHEVQGVVTDSLDAGLGGATVVLLDAADSTLVSYGITRDDGLFRLRRAPAGSYLLQVTFVGLEPYSASITVRDEPLDVGRISMRAAVTALDALVVTAEHVPMVIKKDTLEYNAAAFKVRPNANVEELLRKLPGVEVEQDGSIKAQGETVEQVLVDGKEFFGNDPRIATRNLPADAVDKVQVYDKLSDMAEFSGVDDGEETKTINLALNEESRQGYFGNASGGYGNDVPLSRYEGRASINRFSPTTQLSFIGNQNNINQQSFSMNDYVNFMGGMQALMGGGSDRGGMPVNAGVGDGFSITTAAGLNVSHDFSPRTSLQSSYFLNRVDNDQDRLIDQQQLIGSEVSSQSFQASRQDIRTQNHRLNLNLKHEIDDGQDLRLRADLRATDSGLDNLANRNIRDAGEALVNATNTAYRSDGIDYGGSASLTYRKRLSERGRTLVAEASSNLNDGSLKGDLEALNSFYDNLGNVMSYEEIVQFQSQWNRTFTNRQQVSWTEPLGGLRSLELHGERRQVNENREKSIYDRPEGVDVLNDALSSALEQSYRYGVGGMNLRLNRENGSFAIGVDVQAASLGGDILDEGVRIDRRFVDVLPSATFRHDFSSSMNLDIRYRASTREPSMTELQPFADNSDPLNVYTGNPNLLPEYRHTGTVHFMLFDQFSFTNLFGYLQAQYTTDKIARARTIDEQFRQTNMPVNVDGDWLLTSSINFGTPIRAIGLKVNLSTQTMFNRGIEFINDEENDSRIFRQTVDFRLENRDKEVVDARVGARFTFNATRYSLNPDLGKNYVNRAFYTEIVCSPGKGWRFTTGLDYRLFANEVFGAGERIPIWRAELSRTLLNDRAELQLVGLDLLDRNLGVNYASASNYIQEERIDTLGRYVMLKFVYNLSRLGNRGMGIQMMEH